MFYYLYAWNVESFLEKCSFNVFTFLISDGWECALKGLLCSFLFVLLLQKYNNFFILQDHCLTEIHRIFTPQHSKEDFIQDSSFSGNSNTSETRLGLGLGNSDTSDTSKTYQASLERSLDSNSARHWGIVTNSSWLSFTIYIIYDNSYGLFIICFDAE